MCIRDSDELNWIWYFDFKQKPIFAIAPIASKKWSSIKVGHVAKNQSSSKVKYKSPIHCAKFFVTMKSLWTELIAQKEKLVPPFME